MIRVLHYIPGFLYGGIESMFLSWYKNIDQSKVQFELLLITQDDDALAIIEYRKLAGVYYRLPPFRPQTYYAFRKELERFFRAHHDYDILHVHGETPFVIATAKKYGIPKVIVHSHTSSSDSGIKVYLKTWLYSLETIPSRNRYVDRAFACSDLAAKWMFGALTFKGKPVEIIHNAIDTEKYDFDKTVRARVRQELHANERFVVGHVGRLTPQKNQFFMLEIVRDYLEINPNTVLWIVGDGGDESALKQYAVELGIINKVSFLGVRGDVSELFQGMDCFLLPSRYEGLGIVLIEAQTSGLPCLISDVIPEQADLTDVINRMPLAESTEKWAEKLEDLRKKSFRQSHRDEIIKKGFDVATETEKLVRLYQNTLHCCG